VVAIALPACVAAGIGWLYLLRGAGALAAGPSVRGALPLQQLAGDDGQPLLRLLAAWLPAGALAGAVVGGRRGWVVVGAVAWLALAVTGAVSDATAISGSVWEHVVPQAWRPGTWAAAGIMALGAWGTTRVRQAAPPDASSR
jgi:hypothetical protein